MNESQCSVVEEMMDEYGLSKGVKIQWINEIEGAPIWKKDSIISDLERNLMITNEDVGNRKGNRYPLPIIIGVYPPKQCRRGKENRMVYEDALIIQKRNPRTQEVIKGNPILRVSGAKHANSGQVYAHAQGTTESGWMCRGLIAPYYLCRYGVMV